MSRLIKRLGSDVFLALASLAIAFAVWMISKQGDLTVETFLAPVRLKNVPDNVQVRIEPDRNRAKITLSIPARLRSRIQSDLFRVEYDFLKALPEPRSWCGIDDFRPAKQLDPGSAQILLVSADEDFQGRLERQLQNATIDGSLVVVKGKLNTRPARLVFRTRGQLPPGYRLAEPIKPTDQGTIPLTASPEVFHGLTGNDSGPVPIETEEIDLTDQRKNFDSTVGLRLPAEVELVYPGDHRLVKAQVSIEEITTTVENVLVTFPKLPEGTAVEFSPQTVSVSVRGPEEVLQNLRPDYFVVRPGREIRPQGGLETTVPLEAVLSSSVPPDVASQIAVRSTDPANLTVKYSEQRPEETAPGPAPPLPEPNAGPDD